MVSGGLLPLGGSAAEAADAPVGELCPISYLDHATLPPDAAGRAEHAPWHYCGFIVRVLSTPPALRSRYEAACAAALADDGVGWLPLGRAMSLEVKAVQAAGDVAAAAEAAAARLDDEAGPEHGGMHARAGRGRASSFYVRPE